MTAPRSLHRGNGEVGALLQQLPPRAEEAEACTLGAMLVEPACISEISGFLDPDDFSGAGDRALFQAMKEIYRARGAVDTVLLLQFLRDRDILDAVGGEDRLATLAVQVPAAANARHYADLVKQAALRRAAIESAMGMVHAAYKGTLDQVRDAAVSFLDTSRVIGVEKRIQPTPASQLPAAEEVEWRWKGFLAAGSVTLFTGLWKSGKTTLLASLVRQFATGGDLAGIVTPARVLVVTEESASLWAARRDRFGIGDHAEFLVRPFTARPSQRQWEGFIGQIAELGFQVVVLDTISRFSPVESENDAAEVNRALLPLHGLCQAGAAVLLIHHPRKGDGGEATAARGSGALPAFVDCIVEMRRFDPERRDDRRRVLRTYSRFEESPDELVVELDQDGINYTTIGARSDVSHRDRSRVIAAIFAEEASPLVPRQIRNSWPDGSAPGLRTIERDCVAGVEAGAWGRFGTGRRGDPHTYGHHSPDRHGLVLHSDGHDSGKIPE